MAGDRETYKNYQYHASNDDWWDVPSQELLNEFLLIGVPLRLRPDLVATINRKKS